MSVAFAVDARLWLDLIEVDDAGTPAILATRDVIGRASASGLLELNENWDHVLTAVVPRSGTFRIRLTLELNVGDVFTFDDFGAPGTGRGASMQRIQVCTQPLQPRLAADLDSLERDLYERRCMPSVWLPAAQGGKLESARALVGDLLNRSQASGTRGVNVDVATGDLARADSAVADGDYQRACRSLVDAVHALTTP